MKYKYLNQEELQLLEQELLQFLIVNGIDGDEWKRINQNQPEKAVELVGLFSDLVWQKSLEKVEFGEQISNNHYLIFKFGKDKIEMLGLKCSRDSELGSFHEFIELLKSDPKAVSLIHQSKAYNSEREHEIFQMMDNGLLLSDKSNFDFLKNLYHNA